VRSWFARPFSALLLALVLCFYCATCRDFSVALLGCAVVLTPHQPSSLARLPACPLARLPACLCICVLLYSLGGNSIGAEGAVAIADALKSNSTLHILE